MKRLIIMNIILLVLYMYLPAVKNIEVPTLECQTDGQIYTEVDRNEQIISRSLEESRTAESIAENTESIAEVTTYSENCINLIKKYEGCKLQAYRCPVGNLTVGYGHTGDVYEGQTITQEQAENLLKADLEGYTELVLKKCSYLNLNQNELDALVSFTYNCGLGNLNKLLAKGSRSKEEIAEHIEAYNNNGMTGLVKRRAEEKILFLGGEF